MVSFSILSIFSHSPYSLFFSFPWIRHSHASFAYVVLLIKKCQFLINLFYYSYYYIGFPSRESSCIRGTSYLLILFEELVACWCLFYMLILLSLNLYMYSSPLETDFILVVCWFLFFQIVACWFFIVKLVVWWFFSSWKLYIDFSPCETDFLHGHYCLLILVHGTCCVQFWLMELAVCNFFRETSCMLIFLSMKILHRFFSSWNWFNWCSLLRADFSSWNLLCAKFFVARLVACWFFSAGNLYIDFYCSETDFVPWTCCVLISGWGACCVLIFIVKLIVCRLFSS